MDNLTIGTRIFNHGDMANVPSWSVIIDRKATDYGVTYTLVDEDDGHAWGIFAAQVTDEYKGNGLTRIVTEAAYLRYRAEKLAELKAAHPGRYVEAV